MSETTLLATFPTSLPTSFSTEPRTDEDEDEDEDNLDSTKFWPSIDVLSCKAYQYLMIIQNECRGELTFKRSAFSRNPTFEPAKRQSRERMKAVKESTMGTMAARRNILAISAQQKY